MKVLMLGSDPKVSNENSFARKRMEKYAQYLDKLTVILLLDKSQISNSKLQINPKSQIPSSKLKIYIAGGYIMRFFKAFIIGYRIMKNEKFDLITAQDIEHGLIAFLLSQLFKIPFQQQIHTDIGSPYFWKFSLKNKFRHFVAKFLIPRANCVRVVNARIKKFIISDFGANPRKAAVIPIMPDLTESKAAGKKEFPDFEKIILIAARLSPEKNITLAINAFGEVLKKHPKTGLIIVGDGPEMNRLKNLVKLRKIENNVRFEGWRENTAGYYKTANVYLFTSWYEGFPVAAIEAMSFGLPIITTNVGIAGEIIKEGESGFIVRPGDRQELVNTLLKILDNDGLAKKMGENNKAAALQFFKEEDYYFKIINNWKTCLVK